MPTFLAALSGVFKLFLVPSLLLLSVATPVAHASYQAVITKNKVKGVGKPLYKVHLLAPDSKSVAQTVELGHAKSTPLALNAGSDERVWVVRRQSDSRDWDLLGLSAADGSEVARIPVGQAASPYPALYGFWAQESPDGKLLHALVRKKRNWWFSTFEIDSGEETSSVQLQHGFVDVTALPNDRWFAEVSVVPGKVIRVMIIDPAAGEVVYDERVGRIPKGAYSLSANSDYLYLMKPRKVSGKAKKPGARSKELVVGWLTNVEVIDTLDGRKVGSSELGYDLTALHQGPENAALYGGTLTSLVKGGFKVWRFDGRDITLVRDEESVCAPQTLLVSEVDKALTVFCDDQFAHGSLPGAEESDGEGARAMQTAEVKMKAEHAMYAPGNQGAYALSAAGSRVAKVQFQPVQGVATRATGRGGVKLAKALGSVAGVAMIAATGYGFVSLPNFGSTAMAAHREGDRAYVLNVGTRDVTVLDGADFSVIHRQPVGRNAFALATYHEQNVPWVFSVAVDGVVAFGPQQTAPRLELSDGRFIGMNGDLDRLYFAEDDVGLQVRSLMSLEVVARLRELDGAIQVATPGKPSVAMY